MRSAHFILLFSVLMAFPSCQKDPESVRVPSISFPIDVSRPENEDNAIFEFPLVLNTSTSRDVTVTYEVEPLTAQSGEDFIPTSGSLTFPAGTAGSSIFVEIVVDEFKEDDEQFRVVLTGSTNGIFEGGMQGWESVCWGIQKFDKN